MCSGARNGIAGGPTVGPPIFMRCGGRWRNAHVVVIRGVIVWWFELYHGRWGTRWPVAVLCVGQYASATKVFKRWGCPVCIHPLATFDVWFLGGISPDTGNGYIRKEKR